MMKPELDAAVNAILGKAKEEGTILAAKAMLAAKAKVEAAQMLVRADATITVSYRKRKPVEGSRLTITVDVPRDLPNGDYDVLLAFALKKEKPK